MKKNMFKHGIALAALLASSAAWSIPITTVQSIDTLMSSAALGNSGEATEASWVSSILGFSVGFEGKTECEDDCGWQNVTGTSATDLYAFGLDDSPSYFLVKTGTGSSTGNTHFLFQNIGALDYAVFSLSQLGFGGRVTISKVSHVSEFGSTPVPEPATLGLLGLGVLGLGLGRKRKTRA